MFRTSAAVLALVFWAFSLIFLGATSEGIETIPIVARRRARKSKEQHAA